MAKAHISDKDQRKLHSKSGNRCAMCRTVLVDVDNPSSSCVGENAHIYGEKPDAARYDASQPDAFVNSEKNLIFLCCNCHKKIDTDIGSYSPEFLFDLKMSHEKWVIESLGQAGNNYTFAELEVLCKFLVNNNVRGKHTYNYLLLQIDQKIDKNSLQPVQKYIDMGLSSIGTIEDYLNKNPDPFFATILTSIFSDKYNKLKQQKTDSCEIFYDLWDFACGNKQDFEYRAAGLGILTYFFEKCEVFEK